MHEDLATAHSDHERATERWLALVEGASPEQCGWRPAPERWSVAQCLDHVTITTGALLPGIERAIDTAHERGVRGAGPFRYGPLGRWFLAAQAPGSDARVRTPGRYRPAADHVDMASLVARFLATQHAFGAAIASADGLHLARVRVASPAFALLRLALGIWLRAMPAHTLRHLAQAERVRADARFPA